MRLVLYNKEYEGLWDEFILKMSINGTFLHTRKFLSYHGARFVDKSYVVLDEKENIIAVFPAAESLSEPKTIVSHPGITYGGLVVGNRCRGGVCVNIFKQLMEQYTAGGYGRLAYKAVPNIYHSKPFQDDLYALFRVGAKRWRCDLSATIDLSNRGRISSRRKRGFKKAVKSGVSIASGSQYAVGLWDVLRRNLKDKHEAKPVHALDEIVLLSEHFPDSIQFIVALHEAKVEAGVVLFQSEMVCHSQYIASSDVGYAGNALDLVFEHCIAFATESGQRYFDFGISNEDDGRVLNEGLYGFKSEFGAGGTVHEFYEIDLEVE